MAKLIPLILLFVSCAQNQKKSEVFLSINMRDSLFAQQSRVESYKNIKDEFFTSLKVDACLVKWEEEVAKLKKKLREESADTNKAQLWFDLGNCYNYVGRDKLTLFYYDLALSSKKLNSKQNSVISYNFAQIYGKKNMPVLVESYLRESLNYNPVNSLALVDLSLIYSQQGEHAQALRILSPLKKKFPRSDFVNFLIGVNYFGMADSGGLESKVLKYINDKSSEALMLSVAKDFLNGTRKQEELLERLGRIEVTLAPYKSFIDLLQKRINGSVNEKTEI